MSAYEKSEERLYVPSNADAYIFGGEICSGKTRILEKVCELTGGVRFSTGQVIEEDLKRRGKPTDRFAMQVHGDTDSERWAIELKEKGYEVIRSGKRTLAFECVRYPVQIQILREAFPRSYVIGVKAPREMRFGWMRGPNGRNREGDPETIEELEEADRRDWEGYITGVGQNTKGCFEVIEKLVLDGKGKIINNNKNGREYLWEYALEIVKDFSRIYPNLKV